MDLEQRLSKLKPKQLNCNVFSVYDYCGVSIQELLSQFFEKINNCIDISNGTIELAKWLVDEGLEQEVAKQLEIWLIDGTLGKIINEILLKELEEKVEINENNISKLQDYDKKQDDSIESIRRKADSNSGDINRIQLDQKVQDDRILALELNSGGSGELPIRYVNTVGKSLQDMCDDLSKTATDNAQKGIFRIGSFNINSFRKRNAGITTKCAYKILAERLNICCVQEWIKFHRFDANWWMQIPKAYEYTDNSRLWLFDGGWAGQGLVSHNPLMNTVTGKYTEVPGKETRGYIKTTINVGNKQVNVYNTHLTHDDMGMLRNEMSELANAIRSDSATYKVVCGDFNTYSESDFQPLINLGFRFALQPSNTIDNVLFQSNVNLKDAYKVPIEEYMSDHDLVVAELELI